MSSYHIPLPSTPVHISFSATDDAVAALFSSGDVQIWDLYTRIPIATSCARSRGGGKVAEPKLRWQGIMSSSGEFVPKQVVIAPRGEVAVLFWADKGSGSMHLVRTRDANCVLDQFLFGTDISRLLWSEKGWLVLDGTGTLLSGKYPSRQDVQILTVGVSQESGTSSRETVPLSSRP